MKLEVEIYFKKSTIILRNQFYQMKLKSLTVYTAVTARERPLLTKEPIEPLSYNHLIMIYNIIRALRICSCTFRIFPTFQLALE